MGHESFTFVRNTWIEGTPYRVVRPIGVGGMGEVYEVDHTRTGTRRALKILRPSVAATRSASMRFEREARCLQQVNHPNVVKVFEYGWLRGGVPYFSMELLEGRTLASMLADGALDLHRAVDIALQVLDGLTAVHRLGFVHRDVKPSNIMLLPNGCVKLLDFGIAGHLGPQAVDLTRTGYAVGTGRYMAPEQLRGAPADRRMDVYAVGTVLFEMLMGIRPFEGASGTDGSVYDRLTRSAPHLKTWGSDRQWRRVGEVIDKALARHPSERFSSAHAFARALRLALGPEAPLPWASRFVESSWPRVVAVVRSHPVVAAVGSAFRTGRTGGAAEATMVQAGAGQAGGAAAIRYQGISETGSDTDSTFWNALSWRRSLLGVGIGVLLFSLGALLGWSTSHLLPSSAVATPSTKQWMARD